VGTEGVTAFTCPCCGATSYHPKDIEFRYCGRCHWWTGDPNLGPGHLAEDCPNRTEGRTLADLTALPWRQGRSQPRNVYARTGGADWKADTMIGQLDTAEIAAEACEAHNEELARRMAELRLRGARVSGVAGVRSCPFCGRIERGEFDYSDSYNVAFQPLNQVTPGHFLVVPRTHISHALESPPHAGRALKFAGYLANQMDLDAVNFITSAGAEATQTVFHLHLHVVPRREGDGLVLPWTGQKEREAGPRADR
jgi:histidine triad (HIT) family protein